MICAFLSPYPFRGQVAPYLWVFYKLLASIDERMAFIISRDYLEPADGIIFAGRSEVTERRQAELGYSLPGPEELARHHFGFLDDSLFFELLPEYNNNPIAFFKDFLGRDIPKLRRLIKEQLLQLPEKPEVILSWSNCPSLAVAAGELGISVVYLEVGPLREPNYRATGYFDFSGVNGNTEAENRYVEFSEFSSLDLDLDLKCLRRAFSTLPDTSSSGDLCGIALQVEDDSNLVCYSNGYDNTSLIARGLLDHPSDKILIRGHPGSRHVLKSDWAMHDASPTVVEFLDRCKSILTVNSSVGVEALLRGIPVKPCGDASYVYVTAGDGARDLENRLAFYLLAYLVPFDLIFSPDYIRFRLGQPSEWDIISRHLVKYGVMSTSADLACELGGAVERMAVTTGAERAEVAMRAADFGMSKLYYRSNGQQYSEENSLVAENQFFLDGGSLQAKFVLPAGARPSYVRFDPPAGEGNHELLALRWGWMRSEGSEELAGLADLDVRLVAASGPRYLDDSYPTLLADNTNVFFELSVDDLWASALAHGNGVGVLEFSFSRKSMQAEMAYVISKFREQLQHLEEVICQQQAINASLPDAGDELSGLTESRYSQFVYFVNCRLSEMEERLGALLKSELLRVGHTAVADFAKDSLPIQPEAAGEHAIKQHEISDLTGLIKEQSKNLFELKEAMEAILRSIASGSALVERGTEES